MAKFKTIFALFAIKQFARVRSHHVIIRIYLYVYIYGPYDIHKLWNIHKCYYTYLKWCLYMYVSIIEPYSNISACSYT